MSKSTSDHQIVQLSMFDAIQIPLTKGLIAIIDPIDSDLAQYKWNAAAGDYPYPQRRIGGTKGGKLVLMHQVVMERMIGRPLEKGELPDHIDNDVCNNRRNNLRLATKSTNAQNAKKRSDNTSGYKGVAPNNSSIHPWRAYIRVNEKQIHLGSYETPEEAYAAYCEAAEQYFGEFKRLE